jgi:hypothetical protein
MITIASVLGILYGFYLSYWKSITFSLPYYWKPYSPYLINANLFLIVGIAALINIFPSAAIGRCLHTGRFLFHHYVYGFFVLITSSVYIIGFTSVSLLNLFFVNSTNIAVNTGRFFILTGLTLFIDDLPDVSKRVESALNKLKSKIYQIRKIVHVTQIVTGIITFYVFLSMALSIQQHSNLTVANVLTMSTILITSFTSFASAKRKDWLKITIEK